MHYKQKKTVRNHRTNNYSPHCEQTFGLGDTLGCDDLSDHANAGSDYQLESNHPVETKTVKKKAGYRIGFDRSKPQQRIRHENV